MIEELLDACLNNIEKVRRDDDGITIIDKHSGEDLFQISYFMNFIGGYYLFTCKDLKADSQSTIKMGYEENLMNKLEKIYDKCDKNLLYRAINSLKEY